MARPAATRSYSQLCGIATALDVVGDRWALLVLRDLLIGPLRFGDLADGLPGIGTNTLAARLKHLEASGVISRRLLPMPERGTVYELTSYGRELEPILLALGRWGTKRMGCLPPDVTARSRWLIAAMLAFRNPARLVGRPTTWELRLTDGAFTVRADGADLVVAAGAPDSADLTVTATDQHLHQLLTGQLSPAEATRAGLVTLAGDPSALPALIDLFVFPDLTKLPAPP
jgi:DNA-binding HxlR family transcriptional regulator